MNRMLTRNEVNGANPVNSIDTAMSFLKTAKRDLTVRKDRVDAMDMLRFAQADITNAMRVIRASLRADGVMR